MKITIMLILLAILSGCGYVSNDDMVVANELCANNGGLKLIQQELNIRTAICNNSAEFNINNNRR